MTKVDDLDVGKFIAVSECFETTTQYSVFGCRETNSYPVGIPMRIEGISLPFICVSTGGEGNKMVIDTRECKLQRVTEEYFDAMWAKPEKKKKKKEIENDENS